MTLKIPFRIELVLMLGLILSACGGSGAPTEIAAPPTELPAPEIVTLAATSTVAAPTLELTSAPPTQAASPAADPALDLNNLPDVPLVEFQGNNWFQPTAVSQIQLVSGKVQLFDFSAVW
ncbi:MAG: hypothetical protein EPO32_11870 [Anaerolineae bacterium]|nr:MAG: hypothetical protein EPO32_11870 [Anaerolineae bacterium]